MPGQSIPLGPFTGGLTNQSYDPATAEDTTVLTADNFVYDKFGNLVTRQPAIFESESLGSTDLKPVGWYLFPQPDGSVEDIFVVTNQQGTWVSESGGAWEQISNYYLPTAIQFAYNQVDSCLWFAASPNQPGTGGYWRPSDSSVNTLSNIPQALTMAVYNNRIFFANIKGDSDGLSPSYLVYSAVTPLDNDDFDWKLPYDPEVEKLRGWPGYTVIGPEDGGTINCIIKYYDALVCLKDSTTWLWSFSYDIRERQDHKLVSPTVGTPNDWSAIVVSDILYTAHEQYIYRYTGQSFQPISEIYKARGSGNISLSSFLDNLVWRQGSSYYVFNLNLGTWTTWSLDTYFCWLVPRPAYRNSDEIEYIGGAVGSTGLVKMYSEYSNSRSENFTAKLRTKYYTFGAVDRFKRLFAWGAHVKTDGEVRGSLDAVALDRQEDITLDSTSKPTIVGPSNFGYFYKFLKGYRFKQVSFYFEIDTDGTTGSVMYQIVPVIRNTQYTRGKALTNV